MMGETTTCMDRQCNASPERRVMTRQIDREKALDHIITLRVVCYTHTQALDRRRLIIDSLNYYHSIVLTHRSRSHT
jgi:hypothetical protein